MAMCIRSCFSSFENTFDPPPNSCTPIKNKTPFRSFGFVPILFWRVFNSPCHFLSKSRSRLNMLQFSPKFKSSSQVRNNNRSSDEGGNPHSLIYFRGGKSHFLAFSQVIFNTIIATQHQRTSQSDQLLAFNIQVAFG